MPDITHQQILDKVDVSHEQLTEAIDTSHDQLTKAIDKSHQQLLEAMTQQLGVITDNMVTKQDLKEELKAFVTKDDLKEELKRFATKDDLKEELKSYATKDDLAPITTRLDRIERKIDSGRRTSVAHHLAVRADIGDLNRQFGNLREGLARAAGPI